ncbi:Bug family tripartite tricarboxylate transporter substrate binding protein [Phreatobacter aquaticus]|nr:tripartite tricarboxylate transporter substrate binding protein [Phreatobacter aquaticus]
MFTLPRLSRRRLIAGLAALPPMAAAHATSQVTRVVIAFPPGGTSTASMRPLLAPLTAALGGPVHLDYKPGAGGDVAALTVVGAPADGRTLLFGHAGPLAINHYLLSQHFFDPLKDLAPVAQVISFPIVVCAHERLKITRLEDVVAAGRNRALVTGSSGNGSIQHLASEVLRRALGFPTLHIPFAGGGPLQEALVKGALDVVCETGSNVVQHLREGRLQTIGVMARERLAILPDVPTFAELGLHGLDIAAWFGLLAPAATAPSVVQQIAAATLHALALPDVRTAMMEIGGLPAPLGPAEFAAKIAAEDTRWEKVIREAQIAPLGTATGLRTR